jgi:hypothetical protein
MFDVKGPTAVVSVRCRTVIAARLNVRQRTDIVLTTTLCWVIALFGALGLAMGASNGRRAIGLSLTASEAIVQTSPRSRVHT